MGNILAKPITTKKTDKGEGNGLKFGVSSMQGWRTEMEDAHCTLIGLNDLNDWSYFAVFDGHAGPSVSKHCAENLLNSILESDEFKNSVTSDDNLNEEKIQLAKEGIRNGFLKLDDAMKVLPEMVSGEKSGSTAVCTIISSKHIFFINCGDSRAVLSNSGKVKFITGDHKPFNPAEKERIQNAGGSVMIQRVNGSLAVSRALGDYEYKQCLDKNACEQLVSPEPEINVIDRDKDDEFLILACDGIWDVIDNERLCAYVRHQLQIETDLDVICCSIIDTCFYKGSLDNMTIILIVLPGAPQFNEEKKKLDRELDQFISMKIKDLILENSKISFEDVLTSLKELKIKNLPPGGRLDAKKNLIRETYFNLTGKHGYYID